MLGIKIGLFLLVILFSITVPQSFADSILIEFDKPEYHTGDSLEISGYILDLKMPEIGVSIYDPDGIILSANNVDVDSDGLFSRIIALDSPFYDKPGEYSVKLNYGKISQTEFFNIIDDNPSEPKTIIPELIDPEIISLNTDKNHYYDNDFVIISGTVSVLDSPSVLIGVYDQFGTPMGFYFGEINSNLEFTTKFLVKSGVNFKADGIYSIKAHYGASEKIINFNFSKPVTPTYVNTDTTNTDTINTDTTKTNTVTKTDTTTKTNTVTPPQSIIVNNDTPKINSKNNDPNTESPKNNSEQNVVTTEAPLQKYDNLSVEDIELGILLNQINLECDKSEFIDTISYYDGMGPALYRLCKFDQSLEFFNDSLKKDPNNVEIIVDKGSVLGKLGQLPEAMAYYDQALKIDPTFAPAINNKANALASMGKYDESISLYDEAIQKNPGYDTARKNLTLVLSKISQENQIISAQQESPSEEISSETVPLENVSVSKIEKPFDIFKEISNAFSSLGSLFGFQH
ncbi:MAG TPA: tetratricopeptide repeat protein [Nitrosarchaeum sp.]|nr:tetratricopeptide repeat protein [Nitrosarchaeum sp.]